MSRGSPDHATTGLEHGGRILVIDDEENIRDTLSEFLSLTGYEVDTAANGADGLDRLGREPYDLVLSDLKMPGVDGIAVIEWVKETQPDLPVLVMSGHATVDSTIQALRLGAYDYLLKPFTLDEIERTIENCLEKRRLRAANTELTAANERLREIERIKDDLLATVSHEFRTPLTAMKGFLALVRGQDVSNMRSDQLHALQAIRANVDRLDTMIGNLLTLVEAQDGSYQPILEPTGVGEFLDEYLAMARESRDLDQLEVDCDADARATDVLLDRIRFPLAVTNLIDNAYKFSRTPDQAEVLLRLRRVGEQVHLEVHDDGIGIADTLGDHVFERFTQGDMTATREFQGAGLGLAVVREIVTAHDGRVQLVSPVLNGTAIRIALPVAGGG
ncbi:MAG TPA: hybrid sensor histidine kinase/response regulator [bacterium]|nr:hybrid sensor histidine kinase/response regulator [bacterium]